MLCETVLETFFLVYMRWDLSQPYSPSRFACKCARAGDLFCFMSSSQHRSAQIPRFTQHSYAQTTHKRTYHDSDATVGSSQIDANHIAGIGTLPPPSTKDGLGGCRRRGAGVGRKRTGRTSAGEAAQAAGGKSEGHSTSCKDVRKRSPSFSIDLTSNWLDMPCGA